MNLLEKKGLEENTLIIFSSDNGPVLDDGYEDNAAEQLGLHDPFSNLRGGKYSAFEAGTKVPFIISWPKEIKAGQTSTALFSQIDMLASFAHFTGTDFNRDQAMDSQNNWNTLRGEDKNGRQWIVQEAIQGGLSIVDQSGYKYIAPKNGSKLVPWGVNIETGFAPEHQLYNLKKDPQEIKNTIDNQAGIANTLKARLDSIRKTEKFLTKSP